MSDRDGGCRQRVSSSQGDVECEQYAMCSGALASSTTGLSSMSAQVDSKSNKAVPSFSGFLPRALDTVVAPPTQCRSVTCLSPAVPNLLL